MYSIFRTNSFKKDYKKLLDDDKKILREVVTKLVNNEKLESKYKDHKLRGNLKSFKECHLRPDLLLIYKKDSKILELALIQIGKHSCIF
ncbi:MAG: type II toxin-antitoxin system YafQ family toxin [Candidatus Cloacimonetes bacterium]|nr:type II toxin-antitoxin system YafQ family toxin [Candidatus Cloacimonadota bacterium]